MGIRLGKYIAKQISSRERSLLFGPSGIVFIFLGAFLVIRTIHPLEYQISIQAEIYADEPVITQFFTTDSSSFNEKNSKYYRIKGGRWEARTFILPEFRIHKLRFDPGDAPGVYRIRNLNIEYPWITGPLALDVSRLTALSGISELTVDGDELVIRTNIGESDPILIYEGDLYQPLLRPWSMAIVSIFLIWLLLFGFAVGLDTLSSRFNNKLNGQTLLN